MIRLSGKGSIACTPAEVAAFLADVSNEPKWQRDIVHVKLVEGTPGKAGAKWERVQVVGGRNIKTITELAEVAPGRRVAFKAAGKVIEYTLTFTVAPSGAGTDLEMKLEGEMLGFASMFEGMAADELGAAIPEDLGRLAKALEA